MATTNMYEVEFEIQKPSTGQGKASLYRRGARKVVVQAVSAHPKDILVPLNNNVTLAGGEVIDILAVKQVAVGSEGSAVWQ